MKAVILAAGKGTRLQPLTNELPKGLIKVQNKPILEYVFDSLLSLNIEEIIVIIGYKGKLIQEYFSSNYKQIPIRYIIQEEQLGTGHALNLAKNYVTKEFLVLNGDDIYSSKDLVNLSNNSFAILSQKVDQPESFGVIIQEHNILKNIVEKPRKFISNKINVGAYKLTTQIFNHTLEKSQRGEYEIIDYLNYIIQNSEEDIKVVDLEEYWIPINTLEQLKIARKIFL